MNIKLTEKDKIRVSNPDDIYGIMQRILLRENKIDREKEHFWIVGMNAAAMILYIELVSMGSVRSTLVEPMNVFRVAILKGATRVIAVHNHPSGTMRASKEDEDCTDKLIQVGRIIDIKLEDHLIISPTTYISFKDMGLMDTLGKSIKYVPTYQLIDSIRREEKTFREEANKKHKQEIKQYKEEFLSYKLTAINNLLEKNIPIEEIAVILNLTVTEVKKISNKKKP